MLLCCNVVRFSGAGSGIVAAPRYGIGVAKNDALAFEYYERAALGGNKEAQNNLGYCYQQAQLQRRWAAPRCVATLCTTLQHGTTGCKAVHPVLRQCTRQLQRSVQAATRCSATAISTGQRTAMYPAHCGKHG